MLKNQVKKGLYYFRYHPHEIGGEMWGRFKVQVLKPHSDSLRDSLPAGDQEDIDRALKVFGGFIIHLPTTAL
jgi:hypothetical protein